MTRARVILGMSGGVDSSVAAFLLVEQGFEVQGVTLQVWEQEDESVAVSKRWQERGCCKVGLAKYVAKRLGIAHEVIDTRAGFRTGVIEDFLSAYLGGTTPNPCVRCNERVKIRSLYQIAEERRADFIATGHYARIVQDHSRHSLRRANDSRKDQSYFLHRISPAWLPRILFPVGSLQKSEVWARAESLGLPTDELKESQEICFVTQGSYRTFIQVEKPESRRPGLFTDTAGNVLGHHEGIAYYTPGQRRGLGIAAGRRLYVHRVVPESETVVLGPEESLFRSDCVVADLNVFDESVLEQPTQAEVKVRYATPAASATLQPNGNRTLSVFFHSPQRALSPGQSAVFYDGDRVLGGGMIQ
ncbi:MAG TPA: tRNA 2-thiouridine(34) synthase MnmA [Candidatus Binatia bacterium]|nr:tRNA 2-thiouridine(34) synthase MnmA [Candidatus Binatia bacterium]